MRARRYQAGNSEGIPMGTLNKMIFSMDSANLPMLTWKLSDGSILQVQRTEYMDVIRYRSDVVAEAVYVVQYFVIADGKTRIKILDNKRKVLRDFDWNVIPEGHFLKTNYSLEWKVGNLIYVFQQDDTPVFYNPNRGTMLDYCIGFDPGSYISCVSVEDDVLYIAWNNKLKKIKPVKSGSSEEYIFEEEVFVFANTVFLEEGVFYYTLNVVDENSYSTVAVINKNTGTFIIKDGYYKYTDPSGSTMVKEWFTPASYWEYTNVINLGISQTSDISVHYPYRVETSHFVQAIIQSGNVLSYSANHVSHSLFGRCFYRYERYQYPENIQSLALYNYVGNCIVIAGSYGAMLLDSYKEWNDIPNELFYTMVRKYKTEYELLLNYVLWNNEQITIEEMYSLFSLLADKHTINYMAYLPGLEKDPTIAVLLK
jgi:hypothetical protein